MIGSGRSAADLVEVVDPALQQLRRREMDAFDALPASIKAAIEAKPFRVTARYCLERLQDGKTEQQVLDYIAGIRTATRYVEGTNLVAP